MVSYNRHRLAEIDAQGCQRRENAFLFRGYRVVAQKVDLGAHACERLFQAQYVGLGSRWQHGDGESVGRYLNGLAGDAVSGFCFKVDVVDLF